MEQKTIQGNQVLARQIRSRRNELGLTIEEAYSYRQMQRNLQSTELDRFPGIRCQNL